MDRMCLRVLRDIALSRALALAVARKHLVRRIRDTLFHIYTASERVLVRAKLLVDSSVMCRATNINNTLCRSLDYCSTFYY